MPYLFTFIVLLFIPRLAQAIPPPDFLFQVGAQLAQIFAIAAVFLSAFSATFLRVFKGYFQKVWCKKWFWALVVILIIGIALLFAYWYDGQSQKQAYQDWLQESQIHNNADAISPPTIDSTLITSSESSLSSQHQASPPIKPVTKADFFEQNSTIPLSISNQEFQELLKNGSQLYVLDAREDEEYAIGHFPESNHIRFADILSHEWMQLPTDQIIYVFCWSGIRGKEVVEFLRSKHLVAQYLENGANDWVSFGGSWDGGIKFTSVYTGIQYQQVFTLGQMKERIQKGVTLIDVRSQEKFDKKHLSGSLRISIIYTPSEQIETLLSQVPKDKPIISICDDFVSCFDAKIIGLKLEKKGYVFLGRYNKPWEY